MQHLVDSGLRCFDRAANKAGTLLVLPETDAGLGRQLEALILFGKLNSAEIEVEPAKLMSLKVEVEKRSQLVMPRMVHSDPEMVLAEQSSVAVRSAHWSRTVSS